MRHTLRRSLPRALLATAIAALLLPGTGARDLPGEDLPALVEGGGPGSGWASVVVDLKPGARVHFVLRGANVSGSLAGGATIYDAQGRAQLAFGYAGMTNAPGYHVDVRVPPAPGISYSVDEAPRHPSVGLSLSTENRGNESARIVVAAWLAGDFERHAWSVRAESGVRVLNHTSGTQAFLVEGRDFRGTLNAYAQPANDLGLGAGATVNAARNVTVKHAFHGMFFSANFKFACATPLALPSGNCLWAGSPGIIGYETPAGSARGPGATTAGYFWGTPAGEYRFSIEAWADARADRGFVAHCTEDGTCALAYPGSDYVILAGADIRLATP